MSFQIEQFASGYARSVGATKKGTGAYHWSSPKYNQRKNIGRYVKLESAKKGGDIIVYDNKKGRISIGKTDEVLRMKGSFFQPVKYKKS